MSKLLEGYYKAVNNFYELLRVENGEITVRDGMGNEYTMTVEYGDFGEVNSEIQEKTGVNRYNFQLKMIFTEGMAEGFREMVDKFVENGVLLDDGMKCVTKGAIGVSELIKITEEEKIELENNYDPIEAPPGPYKVQPDVQGKILWFSGAPGMGKSTTAQILAREDGYVYYEADCFTKMKNPYIPLDEPNPSMAQVNQKNLKGPGMQERQALNAIANDLSSAVMMGKEHDREEANKVYSAMAEDIKREKMRIGGDWAVAGMVMTREARDNLRKILGRQLVFILLTMPSEDRRKRILSRHGNRESAVEIMDRFAAACAPGQEGEPNTLNLSLTAAMSKEEVVEEVRKFVGDMEEN